MTPMVNTVASVATGNALLLNHNINPVNVGLAVVITGTLTAKVQYSLDNPATATDTFGAGLNWFDHATLVTLSASAVGNIAFPVRAVRLNVTAYTSGSAVLTVIQAGV